MRYCTTIALIVLVMIIIKYRGALDTAYVFVTLFNKNSITENFRSLPKYWFHNTAKGSGRESDISHFTQQNINLPETFTFNGMVYNMDDWLRSTRTTGLVVLQVDSTTQARMFEKYFNDSKPEDRVISWSVGKSVVSMLIGIAINEGSIKSVDDMVTEYAPHLKNTAYSNVTIKQVLQMSSGVRFDEGYSDFFSDINIMAYWIGLGGDLNNYVKSLHRDFIPGTRFSYKSIDTQVLGMVLMGATNQSLTSYFEKMLLRKTGFESDCEWLVDFYGRELAFGTLNMRTRDFARFGWLLLNEGLSPLDRSIVIPSGWIREALEVAEPHLKPNYPNISGYGYQIWLPGSDNNPKETRGDFIAIGIFNQFVYVDPYKRIVIAKNSANHHYIEESNTKGLSQSELETIVAFRAISDFLSK